MGFLNLFAGPSPEKLERKGDALFQAEQWGMAKLEYEHALEILEKSSQPDPDGRHRLNGKLLSVREALASEHRRNAERLIEGGFWDEGEDLLTLALELTDDGAFRLEVEKQIRDIETLRHDDIDAGPGTTDPVYSSLAENDGTPSSGDVSEEEYFFALCGTLPEEVQDAYLDYGENFKAGYMALNRGDFETAEQLLSRALDEHPDPDSYISLELAAACVNLDRPADAQRLLEDFLVYHPEALPAYQLLCDIYWEQNDFQQVDALLASVPEEFAESLAIVLLRGETLHRSGKIEAARTFYQGFLDTFGWNEDVAKRLAGAHEAMGDPSRARALYKEVIDTCSSCRARVDPEIKHKYAELSFAEGMHNSEVLEMYLSLAREIPDNATVYFDRISRIYSSQGNADEALRFRGFLERAKAEQNDRS